ncbi:hypothetical protein HPB50_006539 [Hyalomma asiaticum]|uniref:Uncharacterized protein n=1 Tax=Hyalomma asiaticum TaxID=266040 RepID=A0ACB7SW83_HYAAI|nr:hypothetical protein HPB50_006539 [Hyalomma asiaticum]
MLLWVYGDLKNFVGRLQANAAAEVEPLLRRKESVPGKIARRLHSLASLPFLHVAASRAVCVFVLSSFLLTAVDFGSDNGLAGYEAVALVTASAIGDLVSRVGTGLLLDAKTAAMALLALTKVYWLLLASCFFIGLTSGGRIFACTVMVAELFDEHSLSLSLGITNFIAGIICLARPPLIGHARDVIGSYNPLYVAFAVTNAVFTATWTMSLCWRSTLQELAEWEMALPDTRACWPVAASVAIFVFFGTMLVRSESIMYLGFMDMLQVNREEASWPLTVAIVTSQLSGPLYGLLGIWISDAVLMVTGALLCALPVMACALAHSLGLVVFLYGILFGLGLACVDLVPYTVVARHFVRYRGTVMGMVFVMAAVSGFVFPLMVEALRKKFQFRYVLLILGALELIMLLGCIYVDRVSDHGASHSNDHVEPAASLPAAFACTNSLERACIAKSFSKDTATSSAVSGSHAETAEPHETKPLLENLQPVKSKLTRNLRSLASWEFLHVAVSRAVSFFVIASFLLTAVDFGTDNGLVSFEAVALVTASAVGDLAAKIGVGFVLDAKKRSTIIKSLDDSRYRNEPQTTTAFPTAPEDCPARFPRSTIHAGPVSPSPSPKIPPRPRLLVETAEPHETKPLLENLQPVKSKLTRNLRSLASWEFLHVAVSRAVSFFVIASFLLTAVDFGTDNGLVSFEAVALVTASAVGDLAAKIGVGFVLDAKVMSHEALILWGFAVQAASLSVTVLVKKYWVLLLSCFVTGLTAGSRIFACTVMVAELFDQQALPLGLGVTNFVAGIVCLIRPPLVGYARDVGGSYDLLYVALAIANGVFTLTWAISLCWRKFQANRQREPLSSFPDENDHGVPQG